MKNFYDHPFINLLIIGTVCETIVRVARIIKEDKKTINVTKTVKNEVTKDTDTPKDTNSRTINFDPNGGIKLYQEDANINLFQKVQPTSTSVASSHKILKVKEPKVEIVPEKDN